MHISDLSPRTRFTCASYALNVSLRSCGSDHLLPANAGPSDPTVQLNLHPSHYEAAYGGSRYVFPLEEWGFGLELLGRLSGVFP